MTESGHYDDPFERYSYTSPLIERLRGHDGRMTAGRVTVRAAQSFGFCWGVDRAVAMVHDAINAYPDRRIWLLDQIIHNPRVNADFKARPSRPRSRTPGVWSRSAVPSSTRRAPG